MAKDITLKSPNGEEIYYPKTVSELVYDNETGQTIKEQFESLPSNSFETIIDLNLDLQDENGNSLVRIDNNGGISTHSFNSNNIKDIHSSDNGESDSDLIITDKDNNEIVEFANGHIRTKSFNSADIVNQIKNIDIVDLPKELISVPSNPISKYCVFNDIGLGSSSSYDSILKNENETVSIYLDNFFLTNREYNLRFKDSNLTYHSFYPDFSVKNKTWSNGEKEEVLELNNGEKINIKLRTSLASATKDYFPKILQIGDSVTEGWLAKYPFIDSTLPLTSYSWAKYYFERDKKNCNDTTKHKSLFVGKLNGSSFNYNGIQGKVNAHGIGGWTADRYNSSDSAFWNPTTNKFSLKYYLNKYKTLADDGETRLVVGESAGSEVTNVNAWDLCTPNIVIIQLGMNGTVNGWKTNATEIINRIKAEYPNMIIVVSILMACVCNYPSLYPNYKGIYFDDYANAKSTLLELQKYAIDNLQNEDNNIFVWFGGSSLPMPYSCFCMEFKNPLVESNSTFIGIDAIERVKHPTRYGHQALGYELYSLLKYIMIKKF